MRDPTRVPTRIEVVWELAGVTITLLVFLLLAILAWE